MIVPVQSIIQIVELLVRAGTNAAGHEAKARRAELAAQLRALEIAADREEAQQQAALVSQLIEACLNTTNRPFAFAEEVFRATHGLLVQQQLALIEEKKEIIRLEAETNSQDTRKLIHLRKRKNAIKNELEDIRDKNQMMQKEAYLFAHDHGRHLQIPELPMLLGGY